MALHLTDNFQAGGPITQVPASWFNAVAGFINGLIAGPGIKKFEKTANGATVIELENGDRGSTPTEVGSFPTDEVTQTEQVLWEAGGANGADLLVIFKGDYDAGHNTYVARLELTSDGRISKIVAVKDMGMAFGA